MTGIGDFLTDSENMVEFGSRLVGCLRLQQFFGYIAFGIQNSTKYNGTFARW